MLLGMAGGALGLAMNMSQLASEVVAPQRILMLVLGLIESGAS